MEIGAARVELRIHHHRDSDIGRIVGRDAEEPRRSHTNDSERVTVEVDSLSHCGRITREAALPIVVADHRYRVLARNFVILSREGAPCDRSDAQGGKIAARDVLPAAGRELCLAVHAHVHRAAR